MQVRFKKEKKDQTETVDSNKKIMTSFQSIRDRVATGHLTKL